MAVAAERNQVACWVELIATLDSPLGERHPMVHEDKASPEVAVTRLEVKIADPASCAVGVDALSAGAGIRS